MAQQLPRVEWEEVVEDWMFPAALAFETAVEQCYEQRYPKDSTCNLIIHICTFHADDRPSYCTGDKLPSLSQEYCQLIAHPIVQVVESQPLLQTKVGMKLKECNCLNKMYLFVGVLYALLLFADPGRETYIVQDEPSVTGERHNVYAVVVEILLLMVILALLAHDMKKELIKKCASSFDCIAIAAFCATCQMSVIGELYVTNELTAVYLTVHGIHSCLMTILHFFVASMDSWCCTLWTRLACLMLFAGCLTFFYVKYRFIHIWSEWETCLSPSGCTSFQELYLGAMFNEWVLH